MALQWYDADDVLIDALALPAWQAGETSDAIEVRLWADKGAPQGTVYEDLLVLLCVEDPSVADHWRRQGLAPLDELWCAVRATGQSNAADPTQEEWLTDWQPIGAWRGLVVPDLHSGCARHLELRARVPSYATATAWSLRLVVLRGEHSLALPRPGSAVDRGVVTGIGDPTRSELVRCAGGELLTYQQPPDSWVNVATREVLLAGELMGAIAERILLPWVDGAEEPLVAGESYWAILSQGPSGLTVTSGLRGTVPVKPAPPAGELVLARILVEYQEPITAESVAGEIVYGRLRPVAGDGLELRIHPGQALGGDTWRQWAGVASVPLAPAADQWVWQLASGLYEVTTTAERPDAGALLICEVTTDAVGVVAITDRRRYAGRRRLLTLRATAPWAVGEVGAVAIVDPELTIERVVMRATHPPGTSDPQTVICDLAINGATIYPGAAVDDQRPRAESVDQVHEGLAEVRRLRAGDLLTWSVSELGAGSEPPATLELHLLCGVP